MSNKGVIMSNKNVQFEFIRFVCFIMVVCNHVFHFLFYGLQVSIEWDLVSLLIVFFKPAVPIFMMISGALLLKKDYSFNEIRSKVFKTFTVLLITSLFYYFFDPELKQVKITQSFLHLFATAQISNALWYMYVYLGFLLFLRFFKKMINNFQNRDYINFFVLILIFSMFLPYLINFIGWDISKSDFFNFILSPYILYFIFGHYYINYTHKNIDFFDKRKYLIPLVYTVTLILSSSLIIISRILNMNFDLWNNKADSFQYAILSITLFILLNKINLNNDFIKEFSLYIGPKIYFAYLASDFVIHVMFNNLYTQFINYNLNIFLLFAIISIFICIISLTISLVLNYLITLYKVLVKKVI